MKEQFFIVKRSIENIDVKNENQESKVLLEFVGSKTNGRILKLVFQEKARKTNWPVWLNGWVFVYKLSSCGFESRCCHLNFKYGACFEQGVLEIQANYRV